MRLNLLIYFGSAVLASGCNPESYFNPESEQSVSLLPEELWLQDAREFVVLADRLEHTLVLKAETSADGTKASIFFDNQKEVYKVLLMDTGGMLHSYYFIESILSYSTHVTGSSAGYVAAPLWLVAYAQNRPYAAANWSEADEYRSVDPQAAPLRTKDIQDIVRLVDLLEERENSPRFDQRIGEKGQVIQDKLTLKTSERIYVVNAAKGDKLRVSLQSEMPYIYFTVFPNNGSNMEHRQWEGPAAITGDIYIHVFSAEQALELNFQLSVERL